MVIFEFLGKQYRVNVDDSIMVDFIANKKLPLNRIVKIAPININNAKWIFSYM